MHRLTFFLENKYKKGIHVKRKIPTFKEVMLKNYENSS